MDKNVEKLREALCKAERRLKAAGIEYAPKAGDFASDRSKAVTVLSGEYRHVVEEYFGEPCDDVLGGYDISDEMMDGKCGKELIDDICDHVGTEYFADKVANARHKGKEPVEEGRNNVELNRILPTVAFISEEDAAIYADDPNDYPDTEEFADDDGNVDYEAYDAAVEAHVAEKYEDLKKVYGLGIVKDPEGLADSIYDFNQETLRQADDLWKVGDEQGQADSEALKGLMLDVEANYDVGSRIVCRNERDFQILSASVREAQIKRFSDYLRSLCDSFGTVEWDKSKNNYAYASPKEAGIPEAKGLSEGYLGQTVEDFFDDCGDASAINRVIVYALDDEEPVYDGEYYDLPESILEAPFLEFGTTGQLIVNVADEGSSDYYDTLDDFLGDANVDDVQVWDSDSEDIAYDGDKDSVDDELGQRSFLSFDGPEYITINLDCDKSELDLDDLEEAKGKKGKKKGIRARANVGDPKRNMAFFNMAMGASEYAGKGDGCCAGEGAEAEGGMGESKGCGKTIAKTFKGKGKGKGAIREGSSFADRIDSYHREHNHSPAEAAAFENAIDCMYFGYGRKHWNPAGLSDADADKIWKQARELMTTDESWHGGFVKRYKGYKINDVGDYFVVTDPHGLTVGHERTLIGCEGLIDELTKGGPTSGKPKVDEMTDDELRNMPEGTEKRCIGMLNSMIAYDWDRKETAKEFLDRIEGTHTYDYIKKYVDELGKDKVAELMQRQIDDVDRIAYAGTDSDGMGYNTIIWKDAKRESLKPRRLSEGEATGKANEDIKKLAERGLTSAERHNRSMDKIFSDWRRQQELKKDILLSHGLTHDEVDELANNQGLTKHALDDKLRELGLWDEFVSKLDGMSESTLSEVTRKTKDGKWANVGKDGKADSGTFKTKKEADAQRRAMFANGFGESYEDDVKVAGKAGANAAIDRYLYNHFGLSGVKAMHNYAKTYKEIWDIIHDSNRFGGFKDYLKRDKSAEGVSEAKKNVSKLETIGIQYFGTKNQFNYDKQQLRIDHDAKTYEKGMFTHIARRETVSTPELRRIIQRLDDMGYKEVKHGDAKAPEGYFEAWKSHSKAKYFEAWERHSAEKSLDKIHSEGYDIRGKKEDVMDNGKKAIEESKSKGGLAKKILDFVDKNIPEAKLTDEVIDDWDW